jgi:hypothetical protein
MAREKVDILLTTPYFEQVEAAIPRTVQSTCVGLSYLKAYLNRAGITSKVVDPYGRKMGLEETLDLYKQFETSIYGISATFVTHDRLGRFCKEIKNYNPNSNILLGGWGSFSYKEILATIPQVDFVGVGQGELFISPFVSALKRGDVEGAKKIPGIASREFGLLEKANIVTNLDELLTPDISDTPPFKLAPGVRQTINYYSSRGCPNSCKFCTIKLMHESVLTMSPEKVAEDLTGLLEKYPGETQIGLSDDLFDIRRLGPILDHLEKRGIGDLKFFFQSTAQNVAANTDLLKDSRITNAIYRLDMGIETFSRERLRFFAKPSTPELNWEAVSSIAELGLPSLAYTILDDTLDKLKATKDYYVHPKFWPMNFWMNGLLVFPHTKLAQAQWESEVKPWQNAFHIMMKPFHAVRTRMAEVSHLYEPGLKRFKNDPAQREKWAIYRAKQDRMAERIKYLVKSHFDHALEVAELVDSGLLEWNSQAVHQLAEKHLQNFKKELDELSQPAQTRPVSTERLREIMNERRIPKSF